MLLQIFLIYFINNEIINKTDQSNNQKKKFIN